MPNPDDLKHPLPQAWYDENTCSKVILTYKELDEIISRAIEDYKNKQVNKGV